MKQKSIFKRLGILNISFLLFSGLAVISLLRLESSDRDMNYFQNFWAFASNFFPPDLSVLPVVVEALIETFQIAMGATFFAIILSVPLGFAAARNLSPLLLSRSSRLALNAIRTIPSLIWALLAVAVVGPTAWAGVVALTWYSIGYLGKFFSDAFESLDMKVYESFRQTGAAAIPSFAYGVWPSMRPLISAHSIWMLEYNIRSASIIGYVGAGGIGLRLHLYQEYYQWDKFSTVLLAIFVIVIGLDFFGEFLRSKLLRAGAT